MGKYFKAAEYCPDDKDIYDFLDSQSRTTDNMLVYLRTRGIFSAKQTPKEDLQRYVSLLNFDWNSAVQLVDTVNLHEVQDKVTNRRVEIPTNQREIIDAIQSVKSDREKSDREVFRIKQEGDLVVVLVQYLDVDTSKSRVLQKRERELEIRFDPKAKQIHVSHTDTPRAASIVDNVLATLAIAKSKPEFRVRKIDLSSIRDHKLRLEFFIKMMRGMKTMAMKDVSSIKVDRIQSHPSGEDIDEDNEETDLAHEKLKRAVLMGEQLLLTREYQELTDRGFFISSANWLVEINDGRGVSVEFHAGFSEPSDAKEFNYKVLGEYHRDDNGDMCSTRKKVSESDKIKYQSALENSAFVALAAIEEKKKNDGSVP